MRSEGATDEREEEASAEGGPRAKLRALNHTTTTASGPTGRTRADPESPRDLDMGRVTDVSEDDFELAAAIGVALEDGAGLADHRLWREDVLAGPSGSSSIRPSVPRSKREAFETI